MPTIRRISAPQARRIALAAQGVGSTRSNSRGLRRLSRLIGDLSVIQIDSVNVLERAHYLPAFSRLGPYEKANLEQLTACRPISLWEYPGHEAAWIDPALEPAFRHRMARRRDKPWRGAKEILETSPQVFGQIKERVGEQGPTTAAKLGIAMAPKAPGIWNQSGAKIALEWLMAIGELSCAGRTSTFERLYDLPENVLDPQILAEPTPPEAEAQMLLVERASRALGIANVAQLADYFRMPPATTKRAVTALAAKNTIEPVEVEFCSDEYWLHKQAKLPTRATGACLLSPFDSMVFHRPRLLALFDVDYRIEIYVPPAKRRFGYYVYLFRLRDQIVARVDLKADRSASRLLVQATWREPGHAPGGRRVRDTEVCRALADELELLANWLGLAEIEVRQAGDLADTLTIALAQR